MKKTVKKLNLKNETIRQLGEKLDTVRGAGRDSNLIGCSNGPTCYADDICTGGRTAACTANPCGGGGSIATCFAGGCGTITLQ